MSIIAERVKSGAARMGLELDDTAAQRFARYYDLLVEGNQKMNLTAVLEPEEAVDRHFLDSIAPAVLGLLPEGVKMVDVGTGAGFPGLPLLIARPDIQLTLVDSLNKRLEFLRSVLEKLDLEAEIVHMRAEDFSRQPQYREQFDLAAARGGFGFAADGISAALRQARRRGDSAGKGRTLCRKRKTPARRFFLLGGKAREPIAYQVPERDWQHCLFVVDKVSGTPKAYPRKAGTPVKKPL